MTIRRRHRGMRVDRDSQVRRNVRQAHLSEGGAEALKSLESRSDWTERSDAIIQRGSAAYRGAHHQPIIYGDYFFMEARSS